MRWLTDNTSHSASLRKSPTTTTSPSKTTEVDDLYKVIFLISPLLLRFFSFIPFFLFLTLSSSHLTASSSVVFFSFFLSLSPLSLTLDQSITRWRLTLPCRKQQVLWITLSLTHKCTHVLRAVLIAVGSLSVCTYILGSQLIELSFGSAVRETKRTKMSERAREKGREARGEQYRKKWLQQTEEEKWKYELCWADFHKISRDQGFGFERPTTKSGSLSFTI